MPRQYHQYDYSDNCHTTLQQLQYQTPINLTDSLLPSVELKDLEQLAIKISGQYRQLIVVGMGASVTIPKVMTETSNQPPISITYLDTTDPFYLNGVLASIDKEHCVFLVISQSGETQETLTLSQLLAQLYPNPSRFIFITGKQDNSLASFAKHFGGLILLHPGGGRFSIFSIVGILPALIVGLNVSAMLDAAAKALSDFSVDPKNSSPYKSASAVVAAARPILVNISYHRELLGYVNWYNQLLAESLGKNGKGYTPLTNLAPDSQHTNFQLYLDGPDDKLYTLITADTPTHCPTKAVHQGFYHTAVAAFQNLGKPLRKLMVKDITSASLGAIAMHAMLEVIVLADALGINPFDQPRIDWFKRKKV